MTGHASQLQGVRMILKRKYERLIMAVKTELLGLGDKHVSILGDMGVMTYQASSAVERSMHPLRFNVKGMAGIAEFLPGIQQFITIAALMA